MAPIQRSVTWGEIVPCPAGGLNEYARALDRLVDIALDAW